MRLVPTQSFLSSSDFSRIPIPGLDCGSRYSDSCDRIGVKNDGKFSSNPTALRSHLTIEARIDCFEREGEGISHEEVPPGLFKGLSKEFYISGTLHVLS